MIEKEDMGAIDVGAVLKKPGSPIQHLIDQTLLTAPIEIGESFPIWILKGDALKSKPGEPMELDLAKLATNARRRHHQIKSAGKDFAYAHSAASTEKSAGGMKGIFKSPLAAKISRQFDWIEKNVDQDLIVRLLMIPTHQIVAFWILGKGQNQILVIKAPAEYGLKSDQLLDAAKEFLPLLSEPRIGILDDEGGDDPV